MLRFWALTTYILLTHFQIGGGVWRYKNILEEPELFTVHTAIFLQYEGSSFLEWQYPESCDLNNRSSPNAVMWCKCPGFQSLKPIVSDVSAENEERHLYIRDSFFSYVWYAVPVIRNASENDSQIIRIWIIDPDHADEAEINNTALVPSKRSRYLTKQFIITGQFPVIQLSSYPQTIQSYYTNQGFWEARLIVNHEYYGFHIVSQSVSFHGRSVSSRYVFFGVSPETPYGDRDVSLCLPTGSQLSLVWGACTPHRALLLSDKGTLMTKNAFITHEEVKVDPGELLVPVEGYYTVFEAVLLDNGLIFRIGEALFWRDNRDGILRMNPMKLLAEGVKGLKFRTHCVDYYPAQGFELASVLAWTDHQLYIGGKSLDWQTERRYLTKVLSLPKTATILTASFGSHPAALGALIRYTQAEDSIRLALLTFCETEGIWRTSTFLSKLQEHDVPQGPFQMLFVYSALETLMVWNKNALLYSFHNDSEWGYLQAGDSSTLSQAANGSHIHQVVVDRSRNMLVKMENNVLFFCKVGMNKLLRLHTWADPGSSMVLYLNEMGQITMLTLSDRGLHVQRYPFLMELRSASRGGLHGCPFIAFTHNMNRPVYYLDKRDHMELWAQVVYYKGRSSNVKLHSNIEHLLQITERTHSESAQRVEAMNKTFTIYPDAKYRNMTHNNSGLISQSNLTTSMELLPTQIGNTCYLPKSQISHFIVGCPPKRHIRVIIPQEMTCKMHTFENYTIPGSVLRNPQKNLLVHYDWKRFGCVLRIHYKAAFRPDIHLYDGDRFLNSVDANFIVWEKFGRKDYYFNATMREVACLREAQTWKSVLVKGKNPEEAWGPHNYKSCFVRGFEKRQNLDQAYEIMNRSSKNYLTFSYKDSAIYVFVVKILDPNYSFCDLSAVFAVQTYGIKIPDQQSSMYAAVVLASIILVIVCFSCYRFVTINHLFQKKHA